MVMFWSTNQHGNTSAKPCRKVLHCQIWWWIICNLGVWRVLKQSWLCFTIVILQLLILHSHRYITSSLFILKQLCLKKKNSIKNKLCLSFTCFQNKCMHSPGQDLYDTWGSGAHGKCSLHSGKITTAFVYKPLKNTKWKFFVVTLILTSKMQYSLFFY